MVITLIVPFTSIACTNARIVWCTTRLRKAEAVTPHLTTEPTFPDRFSKRVQTQTTVTKMPVVSTTFLMLNLSFHCLRLYPVLVNLFRDEEDEYVSSGFTMLLQTLFTSTSVSTLYCTACVVRTSDRSFCGSFESAPAGLTVAAHGQVNEVRQPLFHYHGTAGLECLNELLIFHNFFFKLC